jgi:hypothetical protein
MSSCIAGPAFLRNACRIRSTCARGIALPVYLVLNFMRELYTFLLAKCKTPESRL